MFSPPARDAGDRAAIWRGVQNGTFQMVTSDHAPYRFDASGKLAAGPAPTFKQIANGIPGIELRLPLLFSEGVGKGRIELERFVELCCTNPAKIYGLHPKKGTIAIGSDADLALWDPDPHGRGHRPDHPRRDRLLPLCRHDADRLAGDRAARGEVIVDARRAARPSAAAVASWRARPARRRGPRASSRQSSIRARNFGAELL